MTYKIVEFIGPSGVGKTFFYNELKEKIHPSWRTFDNFLNFDKNYKIEDSTKIYAKLIKEKKEDVQNISWTELQKNAINDYFEKIVTIDNHVLNSKDSSKLITDDGLIHNFQKEIISILEKNRSHIEKLISQRKIIYFTASPKTILNNLITRHTENPRLLNNWYGYTQRNNISIEEFIQKSLKQSEAVFNTIKSMNATIIAINLDEDKMENMEKATKFINGNESSLKYITKEDFITSAKSNTSAHWKTAPLENRWEYHEKAVQFLKTLPITSPDEVLEIGTVGVQLLQGSESMDIDGYWDYKGKNPTYLHDARKFPWPPKKRYKAIVALRVFQYLAPYQEMAFNEAKKLSDSLIIVTPRNREYIPKGMEETKGITYDEFLLWNQQIPPDFHQEINLGDFYFWNFKK